MRRGVHWAMLVGLESGGDINDIGTAVVCIPPAIIETQLRSSSENTEPRSEYRVEIWILIVL